jgi:signal transduction histidine kinase
MMSSLRNTFLQEMAEELHDLCQPLTALQCILEVAGLTGGENSLLESLEDSLTETRRIFIAVARMRERILSEDAREWAEGEQHAGSIGYVERV